MPTTLALIIALFAAQIAWGREHPEDHPDYISVNLSARQFNDDALVPRVTRALKAETQSEWRAFVRAFDHDPRR